MRFLAQIAAGWVFVFGVWFFSGADGVFPKAFADDSGWRWLLYLGVMAHLTIVCMSLSFHRAHTHQAVRLHPAVDFAMQLWLWAVTSMSKPDWVAVHRFHHATSDTPRDPHSPVHRGLGHVLALGAVDYARARRWPEVERLRARVPLTRWERWFDSEKLLGPVVLTALQLALFGWLWGAVLSVTCFAISPIFAVGGVNALAHWVGYRNYATGDNSRNLGVALPLLNFILCGELDHNNHHARPRSASFRHRWFEFDVGYVYLWLLSRAELARFHPVPAAATSPVASAAAS
jgi:stearoyl-CoA desaturase (delta-9 desaturase)